MSVLKTQVLNEILLIMPLFLCFIRCWSMIISGQQRTACQALQPWVMHPTEKVHLYQRVKPAPTCQSTHCTWAGWNKDTGTSYDNQMEPSLRWVIYAISRCVWIHLFTVRALKWECRKSDLKVFLWQLQECIPFLNHSVTPRATWTISTKLIFWSLNEEWEPYTHYQLTLRLCCVLMVLNHNLTDGAPMWVNTPHGISITGVTLSLCVASRPVHSRWSIWVVVHSHTQHIHTDKCSFCLTKS